MANRNPLVQQGTLNRLRGSVIIPNFPELNVTAPFLGQDGISLALEGEATGYIPTMTGGVTSPEPYMLCRLTVNLLRTQNLADLFKQQMEDTTLLGDLTVRGDSAILSQYPIANSSIVGTGELQFNGKSAGYGVMVMGYYNINNSLWGL